jgi:hypothetical protein
VRTRPSQLTGDLRSPSSRFAIRYGHDPWQGSGRRGQPINPPATRHDASHSSYLSTTPAESRQLSVAWGRVPKGFVQLCKANCRGIPVAVVA